MHEFGLDHFHFHNVFHFHNHANPFFTTSAAVPDDIVNIMMMMTIMRSTMRMTLKMMRMVLEMVRKTMVMMTMRMMINMTRMRMSMEMNYWTQFPGGSI